MSNEPTKPTFFLDRSLSYVLGSALVLIILLLGSATFFGLVGMYLFHPIIGFFFGLIALIITAIIIGLKIFHDLPDEDTRPRRR